VGVTAYLALGSNLGDRLATLQEAVDALSREPGIRVEASSRVWETEPVGPPQPRYLNAVLLIVTELEPPELLAACLRVESALGRVRRERWGPRTIDIDVLLFDERTIDEPELRVPHPRMHERAFVLAPLLELEPDPMLPGGRRVADVAPIDVAEVMPVAPPLAVVPT
jgi:2-amino-4-hydroxy-6-hydroxymethyldihydropteridine diphosphokinase